MNRAPRLLLAAGSIAALLVGCGGGETTTVVENHTVTAASSAQSTDSTAADTTATTSSADSTASVPSEAPTTIVHQGSFQSPTGNIGCVLIGGIARCDIVQRDWSPPARPASCSSQVDYGQGLEIGRSGPAKVVCAGDTTRNPGAPKLAYGSGSQVGDFVCVSRSSGVTCTNRFNGHGFLISVQSYKLF
jgi:hypothetical protein